MACPASKRCTIAGSVTVTGVGAAGSAESPVSDTGAISPAGSAAEPSAETS